MVTKNVSPMCTSRVQRQDILQRSSKISQESISAVTVSGENVKIWVRSPCVQGARGMGHVQIGLTDIVHLKSGQCPRHVLSPSPKQTTLRRAGLRSMGSW